LKGKLLIMGILGKLLTLCLIITVLAQTAIAIEPAFAAVKKLLIPQFTIKFADSSYDTLPSSTIDPYTGQTVTHPAEHVANYTIQFTIRNVTTTDRYLQYEMQVKGHYEQDWKFFSRIGANTYTQDTTMTWSSTGDGNFQFSGGNGMAVGDLFDQANDFYAPFNGSVDFRLQASTWNYEGYHFGKSSESDWSSTQTLTLNAGNPTNTSTPSPSIPEFTALTIIVLLIIISTMAVMAKLRKNRSIPNFKK
jgi:hypothetical protein